MQIILGSRLTDLGHQCGFCLDISITIMMALLQLIAFSIFFDSDLVER
jgi:hypothetical protein